MRFWTRLTWFLTGAAGASCVAWMATRMAPAGWLTMLLVAAALAASYLAISEQEADEIGPRVSDEERRALGEWAGQRRRESGRLREWERLLEWKRRTGR